MDIAARSLICPGRSWPSTSRRLGADRAGRRSRCCRALRPLTATLRSWPWISRRIPTRPATSSPSYGLSPRRTMIDLDGAMTNNNLIFGLPGDVLPRSGRVMRHAIYGQVGEEQLRDGIARAGRRDGSELACNSRGLARPSNARDAARARRPRGVPSRRQRAR
jgi:hypothetical protein